MSAGPFDLSGRVALVTGGTRGIGAGIASALGAAGADVVVWGRSDDSVTAAVDELGVSVAGRVHGTAVDVGDAPGVDRAFDEAVAVMGRVDVVVASAGVSAVAPSTHELTTEAWRRVLAVDLDGVFFTFRAALRHLVERDAPGSLVAIGSRLSANGQPRAPHYAAAKAGLAGLVRSIAREYGARGIRANLVQPGWIDTPMTHDILAKPRVRDTVLPGIPLGRWGSPTDLGGVAVYLASDASCYHTGDVLDVDGGDGLG